MKNKVLLVGLVAIVFIAQSCFKHELQDADYTVYSVYEEIVNPPDTFNIKMDLQPYRELSTTIQFEDSAVWKIYVSPPSKIPVWINLYEEPDLKFFINDTEQILALTPDVKYEITGINSINEGQNTNIMVIFEKTNLDHKSYKFPL